METSRKSSTLEKSVTGQTWNSLFFEKCLGLHNQNEVQCTQYCPLRGKHPGGGGRCLCENGYVLFNIGFLTHIKGTIYWALGVPGKMPNTTGVISFSPQKHPMG